jgi:hypothetical protein
MSKVYTLDELKSLGTREKLELFLTKDRRTYSRLNQLEIKIMNLQNNPPSSFDDLYTELEKIDKPIGIILGKTIEEFGALGVSQDYLKKLRNNCERLLDIIDKLNSKSLSERIALYTPNAKKRSETISPSVYNATIYAESLFFR